MARSAALKNISRLLEEVQAEHPPAQSFLLDLKRSIELDNAKNCRQPSKTYKPSSMNCIRNMWYQVKGYEQNNDSNYALIGICNSGSDIHERVQCYVDGMKDNGMDCEYIDVATYVKNRELNDIEIVSKQGMETKLFHKKYNMSFLCDGIIKYKNKYYILELKTESANKFISRQGVDPKHYNQGTAYSIAFGIADVIFVYISRDVLDMKSYLFTPTSEMKNALLQKISDCDYYVNEDKCPPKPIDVPRSTCDWCNYKTYCKQEVD